MNSDIGLSSKDKMLIASVLATESAVEKATVFGSRAKGNYKKYSDVDIALYGCLTSHDAERIRLALDELALIYSFDVAAYNELKNAALKEHIDRIGVVVYERDTAGGEEE
ncbi:MAG: nucleotidyltransferase domain-containing protein [Spirochaetaceae bacterium]|jgi:predicted nucleotidyltransferase|nr:nucleotidyltransferase domain-containing protein [Spirochaetaceae bacterium]